MAGVDFDAICAQPRGRVESLAERLLEAAGLDSDFNDHGEEEAGEQRSEVRRSEQKSGFAAGCWGVVRWVR
jgi:hypothetical protein